MGRDFKRSIIGYNRDQVNDFVKARDAEIEQLKNDIGGLRADLSKAVEKLTSGIAPGEREEMAKVVVIAERILKEAEERAARKLADADEAASKIGRAIEVAHREEEKVGELTRESLSEIRAFLASFIELMDAQRMIDERDLAEPNEQESVPPQLTFFGNTGTEG